MSESQAQGQSAGEGTQEQGQAQSQDGNQGKTLTWEEHQAELTRIGTKEKKEGKGARDNELLQQWQEFGVESIEDVGALLEAQSTIAAELEGEEVQSLRSAHKEEVKTLKGRIEKYEGALTSLLQTEREGVPEHITKLLDTMDPADQLSYIAEHRDAIKEAAKPPTIGRGSAPGSGGGVTPDVTPGLGRLQVAYSKRN